MSFQMIAAVKFLPVSPAEKSVLWALADCHNRSTNRCDPSLIYLAKVTSLSERAIRYALRRLEAAGILSCERRSGTSTHYRFAESLVSQASDPCSSFPGEAPSGGHELPPSPATDAAPSGSSCPSPRQLLPPNRNEPERTPTEPSDRTLARPSDWRVEVRREAEEASSQTLPDSLPSGFCSVWKEWCDYRTRRAVEARSRGDSLPWTLQAARLVLDSCVHHSDRLGWDGIIDWLRNAIAGNWKSLNLDKAQAPPDRPRAASNNGNGNPPRKRMVL